MVINLKWACELPDITDLMESQLFYLRRSYSYRQNYDMQEKPEFLEIHVFAAIPQTIHTMHLLPSLSKIPTSTELGVLQNERSSVLIDSVSQSMPSKVVREN